MDEQVPYIGSGAMLIDCSGIYREADRFCEEPVFPQEAR